MIKRFLPIVLIAFCLWGGTSHAADGDHFGEYEYWDNYDGWMYGYYYWMNGRILWWDDAFHYSPGHTICIYDPDNEIDQTNNHTDALQNHDQDGDGISDWDEIQAGSDPTDPEDIPGDDPPEPREPDDPYLPNDPVQDNDNDGEANLTDPDDDNDNHADADNDPDADGNALPDDIENLIKAAVEHLGEAKFEETFFDTGDDPLTAVTDQNGNALKYEKFTWDDFLAECQEDSRDEVAENMWAQVNKTRAMNLAEEGRSGGEEDKLLWRLACTVCPNGSKIFEWEFYHPDICGGKWVSATQYGVMPQNLPFVDNDPANLTTTTSIGVLSDPDGDGQSTGREAANNSDAMNGTVTFNFGTDSDGDNWSNAEETKYGSNIYDNNSHPLDDGDYWDTTLKLANDLSGDYDGDGYSNSDETASGSSPTSPYSTPTDTDNDGRPDAVERIAGTNPSSAASKPSDEWTTNANSKYDNDGDGYSNNYETQNGSDPNDPESTPEGEEDMEESEEGEELDWAAAKDKAITYFERVTKLVDISVLQGRTVNTDFIIKIPVDIDSSLEMTWQEYTIHLDPDDMEDGYAKEICNFAREWIRKMLEAIIILSTSYKIIRLLRESF
jgi:hypothetical protein